MRTYKTDAGETQGLLMSDAVEALGCLDKASSAVLALSMLGVLGGEFVPMAGDVHSVYQFDEEKLSALTSARGRTLK